MARIGDFRNLGFFGLGGLAPLFVDSEIASFPSGEGNTKISRLKFFLFFNPRQQPKHKKAKTRKNKTTLQPTTAHHPPKTGAPRNPRQGGEEGKGESQSACVCFLFSPPLLRQGLKTPANHQSGTARVTPRHPKAFGGPYLPTALAAGVRSPFKSAEAIQRSKWVNENTGPPNTTPPEPKSGSLFWKTHN